LAARHLATIGSIRACQFIVVEPGLGGWAAPNGERIYAPNMQTAHPDEGQDISFSYVVAGLGHLDPVEANAASFDQATSQFTGFHEPRTPEEFV
jgi:hypothetical protein